MDKYLKMADVFVLPVSADLYRVDFAVISDDKDSIVGGFGVDGMSGAAAHAINSHDELVTEVERLRGALQQCVEALYIAHKFCGNHTADECGDEIAIPISDALVVASKLVVP